MRARFGQSAEAEISAYDAAVAVGGDGEDAASLELDRAALELNSKEQCQEAAQARSLQSTHLSRSAGTARELQRGRGARVRADTDVRRRRGRHRAVDVACEGREARAQPKSSNEQDIVALGGLAQSIM